MLKSRLGILGQHIYITARHSMKQLTIINFVRGMTPPDKKLFKTSLHGHLLLLLLEEHVLLTTAS